MYKYSLSCPYLTVVPSCCDIKLIEVIIWVTAWFRNVKFTYQLINIELNYWTLMISSPLFTVTPNCRISWSYPPLLVWVVNVNFHPSFIVIWCGTTHNELEGERCSAPLDCRILRQLFMTKNLWYIIGMITHQVLCILNMIFISYSELVYCEMIIFSPF